MSEEEKKAIEVVKNSINVLKENNSIFVSNKYSIQLKIEAYTTILELIDKQQVEIEKLKDKNKTFENLLQGNLYEIYLYYKELAGKYQANCISKDEIRNLLKQVNASLYHFKDSEKNNIIQRIKDRLEELLEE